MVCDAQKIAGKTEQRTAETTEQTPDRVIAWRSTSGTENSGRISITAVDPNVVRGYDPKGNIEKTGDAMGAMDRRVEEDLQRFKQFIEERGAETDGWRGESHGRQIKHVATG